MAGIELFLSDLAKIVPGDRFSTQADQLAVVSEDESTLPGVLPEALVWAMSTDEIRQIVALCYRNKVPITTRGAGSALEGSAIPVKGGIVLDLSRMTKVIEFYPDDLQVRVQPGIIYDDLNLYLKDSGLFFPPSPGGSGDLATIGGMVSTNASGIYSVKYGGTKDYLLQLEIVTGTGEIMTVGSRAIKRSSGYNLVDIISGSEGTLCVICAITIRLAGLPEGRLQAAYQFPDEVSAAKAVSEMARYGLDLAAVEFLDRGVIEALNQLKDYKLKDSPMLFLEFHGPQPSIDSNAELARQVCEESGGVSFVLGEDQNPWEVRHFVTEAIKHRKKGFTIVRNDVAFPISQLPEMVAYCHELGREYGIIMHTFGHVGMGLLHALMLADPNDEQNWAAVHKVNDLIIRKSVDIGGTVSGEHGIGLGHKSRFELEHGHSVNLMRGIKKVFDPVGILNPGKIFDV